MKVYIDHFVDQEELANRIKILLTSQAPNVEIKTMADIFEENTKGEEEEIDYLKQTDVIIPIITSQYLAENYETTESTLESISKTKSSVILPLIYNKANWSSKNWIVKSKVFPSSEETFSDLSENSKSDLLSSLVKAVSDINDSKKQIKSIETTIKKEISNQSNKVLLSHSHKDADFAELLKMKLEKFEIICWVDNEKLILGQDWREEIDNAIDSSIALIVIMSPEARKSEYVTYEWSYAWGKGKKVLPIMLEQTSLHPRLESLQYLDFTNRVNRPYDKLIERISTLE